jgi:hypothetical protein
MPESILTRRAFLAAAGLSTAAVVLGCDLQTVPGAVTPISNPPTTSPFVIGPYQTKQVILGEDVPQALQLDPKQFPNVPSKVLAAVYFPYFAGTDHRVPTPNPLHVTKGPFPLLLYAHAHRDDNTGRDEPDSPPSNRDFTSVDVMLRHVASYGCVCVAPDLSWADLTGQNSFDVRAKVLVAYYQLIISALNSALLASQVDVSRVVLVGHSRGGGGAVHAVRTLTSDLGVAPLACGLIAPEHGGDCGPDIHNLVVLGGTKDLDEGAEPGTAFTNGGTPKTLVTIPGANHFGYTNICPLDNTCNLPDVFDENGTISRAGQQQTGAAYLAAMVRYYALSDPTARPYLSGTRIVEGLEVYGVTGIQVQAKGFPKVTLPGPTAGPAQP